MSDFALFLAEDEPQKIQRGGGRPGGYHLADGTRVPSVTTITGRFKNAGGLIAWANKEGLAGRNLQEARGDAVDIGSLVHRKIEAEIHGTPHPLIPAEWSERVESAYGAWQRWMESTRLEIVATELALVSEQHRFGGTIDSVARDVSGALCIPDWKSSNAFYSDYLLQIAAYGALWNETHPGDPITGGFHVVRISKTHGDLEHRHFPNLDDAWELFLLLRRAYDLDRDLSKRAK